MYAACLRFWIMKHRVAAFAAAVIAGVASASTVSGPASAGTGYKICAMGGSSTVAQSVSWSNNDKKLQTNFKVTSPQKIHADSYADLSMADGTTKRLKFTETGREGTLYAYNNPVNHPGTLKVKQVTYQGPNKEYVCTNTFTWVG